MRTPVEYMLRPSILGIAPIAKSVRAHGGAIRAESEGAGKDSIFYIELPSGSAP